MNRERFQRVSEILLQARQVAPGNRSAFLQRECGNDPSLFDEVESLLRMDSEASPQIGHAETTFETGLREINALLAHGELDEPPPVPTRIGPYEIIRVLGQGGMGTVYQARQENPQRIVALKVIRHHRVSRQLLKRFQYEVHVLGQLQHPGIACIYSAGTADVEICNGQSIKQPYFAMEYIDGQPLTRFADENRLITKQRLELVATICDAVQHAHQKGVIHRDLKPDNILVGPDGQPKILDFGVARVVDSDVQMTTIATGVGQIVGTLPYMSPEQVRGDLRQIDTRSDVYAIGVVMFELLAGRLPHDVKHRNVTDAARAICEETHERLSTIDVRLRGDIETIVHKALEKDKSRRYQTVGEVARDIRHTLAGEPIEAKSDSTWYVLSKTLAKHRVAALFTVALVMLITIAAIALAFMYRNQRIAHQDARRQAVKAETINEFLQSILLASDPYEARGREVSVREVLDRAAVRVDRELADQPEVAAAAHATIGRAYRELGLLPAAREHLELALQMRLDLFSDTHRDVAESTLAMAKLELLAGDYKTAEQFARKARSTYVLLFGPDHGRVASASSTLAMVLRSRGDYTSAEKHFRETLRILQSTAGGNDVEIALCRQELSMLLESTGQYEEAEQHARAAVESLRRLDHPRLGDSLDSLGDVLRAVGRYDESESAFLESLVVLRRLLGDRHPDVASVQTNLGTLLTQTGHFEKAEAYFREALVTFRAVQGDYHRNVGTCLIGLARCVYENGHAAEAVDHLNEALAIYRKRLGNDHKDVAVVLNNLAYIHREQGNYDAAQPLLIEALSIYRKALGPKHRYVGTGLLNLAVIYEKRGDFHSAEQYHRQALEVYESALGPDHPLVAESLEHIAELTEKRQDYDAAMELLNRAFDIRRGRLPAEANLFAVTAMKLADCCTEKNELDRAESILTNAYQTLNTSSPTEPTSDVNAAEQEIVRALLRHYASRGDTEQMIAWEAKRAAKGQSDGM